MCAILQTPDKQTVLFVSLQGKYLAYAVVPVIYLALPENRVAASFYESEGSIMALWQKGYF